MQKLAEFCRSRPHGFVLAAILLLGGWLRCSRLDLMEFKADERKLHELAVKQAGGQWQLAGIVSSTGLRNPPMAAYLYAIPALVSSDPVAAAMLPALLGTAAIALTYLLARKFALSRGGALAAALLFAVAPWAVIESRKIWAQDLLPFFTLLFFLSAIAWLREGRWRHALAMGLTLSVLSQIHYSSVALWPIVLFLLWRRHTPLALKQLAVGAAIFALLWTPFAVVALRHQAFAPGRYKPIQVSAWETPGHLARAMWWQAQMMGHGGFETSLGTASPEFLDAVPPRAWITGIFLVLIAGGLVAALLRLRARPEFWLLLLWFLLPTVFLSIHRVMFHYFIICWPVTFLLAALFGESVCQWARDRGHRAATVARALVVVFALGLVALAWEGVNATGDFLDFVSANDGTLGDYGVCYREKLAIAGYLDHEVPGGSYALLDYSQYPVGDPDGYRCLADRLRSRRPPATEAPRYPRPPVFRILSPAAQAYMPDPMRWEYRGIVSVDKLEVQCFVPRSGEN